MNTSVESPKRSKIAIRSNMLKQVRSFFDKKKILEVDVPHINKYPTIDLHIEPIECSPLSSKKGYLHTSPEYLLKRLLAEDSGDIYFLGHVFRKDEIGNKHNIEFTMIEWYRNNFTFEKFIDEVIELIELFISTKNTQVLTYDEAFHKFIDVNVNIINTNDLINILIKHNIQVEKDLSKNDCLDLIFSILIEPNLQDLTIIKDYPTDQAALSKIKNNKAQRFEFFCKGVELGNGYFELTDPILQKKRFLEVIEKRKTLNRPSFNLDEKFINSLDKCNENLYGIALGFDRLLMLKEKKDSIKKVLPFSWEEL